MRSLWVTMMLGVACGCAGNAAPPSQSAISPTLETHPTPADPPLKGWVAKPLVTDRFTARVMDCSELSAFDRRQLRNLHDPVIRLVVLIDNQSTSLLGMPEILVVHDHKLSVPVGSAHIYDEYLPGRAINPGGYSSVGLYFDLDTPDAVVINTDDGHSFTLPLSLRPRPGQPG